MKKTAVWKKCISVTAAVSAAILLMTAVPAMPVMAADVQNAAPGEGFVQTDSGVKWAMPDGTFLRNDWLHYMGGTWYLDEQGNIQVGLVKAGDKIYYLTPEGIVRTGWQQIGTSVYYFNPDGSMAVSTAVDGKTIGADGRYTGADASSLVSGVTKASDPTRQQVLDIVNGVIASTTTEQMTQKQKLHTVYNWLLSFPTYKRTYETPSGDWTADFALQLLTSKQGNCFRFAAAFAYIAKALGYDVKVITGQVSAARGGVTPHSWDEVYIDGGWYIFDPELQFANHRDMFERTYSNYPIKPLIRQNEWEIVY